ncbi:MAG: DUF4878 domain-containing protein [bacterium]|nr:DUF4878 domain-containing protein [bacterium]
MKMKTALPLLFLLATVILAGCSGSGSAGGPGGAVEAFYDHMNGGRYDEAKALYANDAGVEDIFSGDMSFADWAEFETRDGSVDAVTIVEETVSEDGSTAQIRFEVKYADGTGRTANVEVKNEGGAWKLMPIS